MTPEQRERKNRRQREKYAANREAARLRSRELYAFRKEDVQTRRRERYHSDPEYRARNLAATKSWQQANPEKVAARSKRWYQAHREEESTRMRAARTSDPERYRAYVRKHKTKHREEVRRRDRESKQARRANGDPAIRTHIRADRARRRGLKCDEAAREYMAILIGDPCSYCGRPADTIDHIVPLAEWPDGEWDNLTAACVSCNASKNASPLLLWFASRLAVG